MSVYIGIDTSNYRTSVALISVANKTWQSETRLLKVPTGAIGLRQSEAVFQHTLALSDQLQKLVINDSIVGIGVSTRPREIEGSYMPCFLVGEHTAKSIAHLLNVPVFAFSHQQGHIASAAFSANHLSLLKQSFYAWHVSGGTTELLEVNMHEGLPHATCIGGSNDLSAGQLIDRTGQLLGLSFPAGAELETLAKNAKGLISPFAVRVHASTFSLSGMENKVQTFIKQGIAKEEIVYFVIETIGGAIEKATRFAMQQRKLPILCSGGVMANRHLQKRMQEKWNAQIATPALSGDNAVGIALLAAIQHGEDLWQTQFTPSPN